MALNLTMVRIPEGSLIREDKEPIHIPSFHLAAYAVTQAQYIAVMGSDPLEDLSSDERFYSPDYPVRMVSSHNAVEFCSRLSQLTGDHYRLPTVEEWEYACRAGTTRDYHFGEPRAGCCNWDGGDRSLPYAHALWSVDQGTPNSFGLYQMHGNVWEWCQPRSDDRRSGTCPTKGGSWYSYSGSCTWDAMEICSASRKSNKVGFRVACD